MSAPLPPPGTRIAGVARWLLVALAAAAAAVSISSYLSARHAGRAELTTAYYCPMHPTVVQDRPGECPICSMALVPKPTGPDHNREHPARAQVPDVTTIDLPPERARLAGLRTVRLAPETLERDLRVTGTVAADERTRAQITTRFAGWVQSLQVAETGARVRRGQVLATIASPEVLRAEEELLLTRGWAPGGAELAGSAPRTLAQSARDRLERLGVAAVDIENLLSTGRTFEAVPIRAPIEGYVIGKPAVVGLAVAPGTTLFEVADLRVVWVNAALSEQDVARITRGQKAQVTLAAYPAEALTGRVTLVAPLVDDSSRTVLVRVELPNRFDRSGPRLKPGMSGVVTFSSAPTRVLLVPRDAVLQMGAAPYVFVATGGDRFQPRAVKLGSSFGDRLEVTAGLRAGDEVVVDGTFLVDAESRLRAALEARSDEDNTRPAEGARP